MATMAAAYPPGRFGALKIKTNLITEFKEKPQGEDSLINIGFFILNNRIF